MDTVHALKEQFGGLAVPAEAIRKAFFHHLSAEVFRRQLLGGTLQLPYLTTSDTQKSPILIDVRDLADWWDQKRKRAKDDLHRK